MPGERLAPRLRRDRDLWRLANPLRGTASVFDEAMAHPAIVTCDTRRRAGDVARAAACLVARHPAAFASAARPLLAEADLRGQCRDLAQAARPCPDGRTPPALRAPFWTGSHPDLLNPSG